MKNVRSEANYTGLIVWSICTGRLLTTLKQIIVLRRLGLNHGNGAPELTEREPLIVSAVIRGSEGPRVTSALELLHLLLHPGTLAADAT